jgi:hypothetical protein
MRLALRVACRSASQSVQREPLVVGSPQVRQGLGIGIGFYSVKKSCSLPVASAIGLMPVAF